MTVPRVSRKLLPETLLLDPLRFYNPDGVLHFAFYDWLQHGLEDLELKNQGEDDREWDENGEPKRPSYRTAQDQSRDKINWGRWVRQPVADPNKDYPQKDVMGSWDFNKPRWIPEQELEPRAGLGDGITQAALQEKTARQPAPAPLSDASKDAIQGMNPSGTIPDISKAKHKVGQREAAYESLRMLAEGAPKSEVKLNCR